MGTKSGLSGSAQTGTSVEQNQKHVHSILWILLAGLIFREEKQRGELPTLAVQRSRETSIKEPKTEPRCLGSELQEGKLQAASCKDGHSKKGACALARHCCVSHTEFCVFCVL